MKRPGSITRRLVATVLLLEILSAAALIGAITVHERRVQLKTFNAILLGGAQSLLGAVQESGDANDNVMLDLHGVPFNRSAIFRVVDERGRVLGLEGVAPVLDENSSAQPEFRDERIRGRGYRFVTLGGQRIIDPGMPGGGVRHNITVLYGLPAGRMWHEVFEAVQFAAIATLILLGVTATVMIWMLRKELSPIYELAREAERINSSDWHFEAPESARNIIELQPLVFALEAAMARLERSFQQQRRFTSDAAHELKTDVAIVKSSLQLLSMRQRSVEQYGQGLALSLDDFTRLEATVEKMLTLSRLEQPAVRKVSAACCSLASVLEDVAQQSRSFAEMKSIELHLQIESDANVAMDRHDALLLCSNILSNALQHSPDGATVWVSLATNADTVCLTVRDQGAGVAEEDRPYLFEPFYRGDPSRSRKSGGTGLGLSICRAVCEHAGGAIEIANHAKGGAVVTVSLPLFKQSLRVSVSAGSTRLA